MFVSDVARVSATRNCIQRAELKTQGLGFRGLGFRVLGFWGFGDSGLGVWMVGTLQLRAVRLQVLGLWGLRFKFFWASAIRNSPGLRGPRCKDSPVADVDVATKQQLVHTN